MDLAMIRAVWAEGGLQLATLLIMAYAAREIWSYLKTQFFPRQLAAQEQTAQAMREVAEMVRVMDRRWSQVEEHLTETREAMNLLLDRQQRPITEPLRRRAEARKAEEVDVGRH